MLNKELKDWEFALEILTEEHEIKKFNILIKITKL
jgi:hypothetical protein